MITGKTESGFEYIIEDEATDDYELLEILIDIDKGDYTKITDMVERLLGNEQKEKLKEHLRKENRRISTKAMLKEIMEIFKGNKNGKNC